QNRNKTQAQWLIVSTLQSRNFKLQEEQGKFYMLWADLDESPLPIHIVKKHLISIIGAYQFEIYTSRSATEDNQKARILIPLKTPLNGGDWVLCQQALNDALDALGATPDRASERTAQLCYLPNRGEFYDSKSNREGKLLDPLERFEQVIEQERLAIESAEQEVQVRRAKAKKRKTELKYTGNENSDLIGAFNDAYTVEDILIQAGYSQRGNTFCHPNSASGSYSASVKDGRVHALSTSDPLYSNGKGAHDAFSAFAAIYHGGH
ncbi:MAG: hypothetical protein KAI17_09525, partial [Thiotrichaceae bacterium]|nr:hypothetical protein [Thiotrichaceae bacterium]